MTSSKKTAQRSPFGAFVVACSVIVLIVLTRIVVANLYEGRLERNRRLEKALGFIQGSPYLKLGNKFLEVTTIEKLDPEGTLSAAGASEGDIPIEPYGAEAFFRLLREKRGETVTVTVVPGGDGKPLDSREKKSLSFRVPE